MNPVAAGGIRTPDQRLRVFVSSTLKELAPERRAVRAAIERLALAPVMFELGARPHPPRELYRAYLEQSDIFVGLYWEQYGWVAPGRGGVGPRGRVGPRPRHPEADLPQAQRAPAGTPRGAAGADPRGRRRLVRRVHGCRRSSPTSSPPTSRTCSPSGSTPPTGAGEPLAGAAAGSGLHGDRRPAVAAHPPRRPRRGARGGRQDADLDDGRAAGDHDRSGRDRQEPARDGGGARGGGGVPRRRGLRRPRARAGRRAS